MPPFFKTRNTNFSHKFINLLVTYFAHHHLYHKVFNRSTVKVSYCLYCQAHKPNLVPKLNSEIFQNATTTLTCMFAASNTHKYKQFIYLLPQSHIFARKSNFPLLTLLSHPHRLIQSPSP